MNLAPMKEGGPNGAAPVTTTIPSLKRTLSGGAGGSLGVGMASIPPVLHATPSTNPPQMLRAVTSSGAYNRPSGPQGGVGGPQAFRGSALGAAGGGAVAATRSVSQSAAPMQDWRMYLTIEERQAVRSKIRDAYTSRCATYEDLLQVACAIEEELLHISAPSRLDYFKSGFEFENRVKLKKDQLQGQLAALDAKRRGTGAGGSTQPLQPQQQQQQQQQQQSKQQQHKQGGQSGDSNYKKQRI